MEWTRKNALPWALQAKPLPLLTWVRLLPRQRASMGSVVGPWRPCRPAGVSPGEEAFGRKGEATRTPQSPSLATGSDFGEKDFVCPPPKPRKA